MQSFHFPCIENPQCLTVQSQRQNCKHASLLDHSINYNNQNILFHLPLNRISIPHDAIFKLKKFWYKIEMKSENHLFCYIISYQHYFILSLFQLGTSIRCVNPQTSGSLVRCSMIWATTSANIYRANPSSLDVGSCGSAAGRTTNKWSRCSRGSNPASAGTWVK